MSKLLEYVGVYQALKDRVNEAWTQWRSSDSSLTPQTDINPDTRNGTNIRSRVKDKLDKLAKETIRRIDGSSTDTDDFSHLTRPKSRKELLQVSAAVMGIEFSYAAETAFVSPLLLNIGLGHRHMTLMWCLSPIIGFFLTPILGSLSDGCRSQMGRRRPFIILLSIGIVLGLLLVPNGQTLGRLLGDTYESDKMISWRPNTTGFLGSSVAPTVESSEGGGEETVGDGTPVATESDIAVLLNSSESSQGHLEGEEETPAVMLSYKQPRIDRLDRLEENSLQGRDRKEEQEEFFKSLTGDNSKRLKLDDKTFQDLVSQAHFDQQQAQENQQQLAATQTTQPPDENESAIRQHPWALFFTVIGTVLLDFDADACQSPSRAYMLDVTIPEDHAKGLSTFTVMAGLGGSIGYMLGALNWENTFIGEFFGGQVRAVFTLVLFLFIGCVITTIRSFREIPIDRLYPSKKRAKESQTFSKREGVDGNYYSRFDDEPDPDPQKCNIDENSKNYGTVPVSETSFNGSFTIPQSGELKLVAETEEIPTFKEYVKTIVRLPKSLQWLCLTNFFCWMSLVCYSLYFTDFVGEAVFKGDPIAALGSPLRTQYEEGVRFGCWGMSLYSLSCSAYSLIIERLVNRFGAKRVYICGQLVYSLGMVGMALACNRLAVILLSWTAGIMYATLFTMPYLLVARYHAADTFDGDCDELVTRPKEQIRGLGTDVAIVSSMVFLAQMTQAVTIGNIVAAVGTTTAVVCAASVLAFCGSLAATKVLYLDL